jgi:hypothetical protein
VAIGHLSFDPSTAGFCCWRHVLIGGEGNATGRPWCAFEPPATQKATPAWKPHRPPSVASRQAVCGRYRRGSLAPLQPKAAASAAAIAAINDGASPSAMVTYPSSLSASRRMYQ